MKSIDDLLPIICSLTYEDKLHWEDDDIIPKCFQTKFSKHRVRIYEWTDDDDGTTGIAAQLYTGVGFGNIIDSTNANQFSSKYPILLEAYIAARRSARNVSEAIEGIEQELKNL